MPLHDYSIIRSNPVMRYLVLPLVLFGTDVPASACLQLTDIANIPNSYVIVPLDSRGIDRIKNELGVQRLFSTLDRHSRLQPLSINRKSHPGIQEKFDARLIGSTVLVFGQFIARSKTQKRDGYIAGYPPDSCGGRLLLKVRLTQEILENPIILEGKVLKSRKENVGSGNIVVPFRLVNAKPVAVGHAAIKVLMSSH